MSRNPIDVYPVDFFNSLAYGEQIIVLEYALCMIIRMFASEDTLDSMDDDINTDDLNRLYVKLDNYMNGDDSPVRSEYDD